MNDRERQNPKPASHNIIMENRRLLHLSGVHDVDSFDEGTIVLLTELGQLTVHGLNLHISRLDQETGEMSVDGEISELIYAEIQLDKKGFFSRIFR